MAVIGTSNTAAPEAVDADEVVAFTSHEFGYLLEAVPGEHSDASRTVLGIPKLDDAAAMLLAGASTLLARRLAVVEDDIITPTDAAALVGENLTQPGSWIEIALLSEESSEAAYVSAGEHTTMVISPRALGTFEVRFVRTDISSGTVLAALLLAFATANAPAVGYARVIGTDVQLAVRVLPDGTLELSRDEGAELVSGTLADDEAAISGRIATIIDDAIA